MASHWGSCATLLACARSSPPGLCIVDDIRARAGAAGGGGHSQTRVCAGRAVPVRMSHRSPSCAEPDGRSNACDIRAHARVSFSPCLPSPRASRPRLDYGRPAAAPTPPAPRGTCAAWGSLMGMSRVSPWRRHFCRRPEGNARYDLRPNDLGSHRPGATTLLSKGQGKCPGKFSARSQVSSPWRRQKCRKGQGKCPRRI